MPGRRIPCLSTWYRHINAGDVGVRHGETPCHPNRKPKGPRPHPAMTVPGRLVLDDRKSRRYVIEKLEHVRRWYPKGTDFGKCTTADMHRLERVINSIHRKLLDGLTAYQYDAAYARAA